MAQDLKYIIRPVLDQASAKAVRDQLNALESSARSGATGSGSSSDEAGGDEEKAKAKKTLSLALDDLTKRYLENAQALVDLREQVNMYKAQLGEIAEVKRANGVLTGEELEQEEALKVALRDTNKDLNDRAREMIVLQQQNEATGTSIGELEKRMAALRTQMKHAPRDTDEQIEALDKLREEYLGVRAQVNQFNESLGNHQHNVGNYENAIRSAANGLAVFQGPLGPIAGRLNAFATVLRRTEVAAMAGGKATRFMAFGMRLLTLAVAPILLALPLLIAFFKRSEEGQDKLSKAVARFKMLFATVADGMADFGKAIINAFTDPKQAVQDLWEAIKENFMVRFRAIPQIIMNGFGTISKGAKAAGLAIKGIWNEDARKESKRLFAEAAEDYKAYLNSVAEAVTGVEDPVGRVAGAFARMGAQIAENDRAIQKLADRTIALRNAERELTVARAEQNRDLQKARDLARDLSASFEDRLAALSAVRESEMSLIERELALERERLAILEETAQLSKNTIEDNDEIIEQQVKVFELEQKNLERSMSLRRDENALIRARNELLLREARRAFDIQRRSTEMNIAEVEREMLRRGQIVELAERRMAEFNASRVEDERLLREQYQQELINQYGDEERARVHFAEAAERAAHEIRIKYLELSNNLADAEDARQRAMLSARLENESLQRQSALSMELHDLEMRNDKIGMLEAERVALEVEMERERGVRIAELQQQFIQQGIQDYEAHRLAKERIDEEYAVRNADIDRRMSKQVRANQEELLAATVELTKNALVAIFGDNKKTAIATAIIDTLAGINAALKIGGPVGFINAAAIAAAGFANVRRIMQTNRDSSSSSTPTITAPSAPQIGFAMVDLPGSGAMATQVAGMAGPPSSRASGMTIILDGEFDKEALAVKVRQGNNAISSRAIAIGV
jgi:hypothetical protein